MSRRNGRIIAFQALFSWDATKPSLEDLLNFSWLQKDSEEADEISESAKEERTFASLIIAGTVDHIDQIDELIKNHLSSSWTIDRINKVSLAILRTAIYEMKYQSGTEPGIIIDEAINIAKSFGTDDSYKFINAVLDNISND
ncbi:MAG: transcription antitermination factor NusB [Treponema sp.]|nr:transcription antitermination factor NusB [Treponema sp.]